MKTLLECLQIAADALKEGRVVKFRHKVTPDETIEMHPTGRLKSSKNQTVMQESFIDPVWEIIEEPDYEGFLQKVRTYMLAHGSMSVECCYDLAKQFNIPTEDK